MTKRQSPQQPVQPVVSKKVESEARVSAGWKPGEVDKRQVSDDDPMVSIVYQYTCYVQIMYKNIVMEISTWHCTKIEASVEGCKLFLEMSVQ